MIKLPRLFTVRGMSLYLPSPYSEINPEKGGIVLHGIADPGNAGTILRTAAAFGWKQCVWINGCDPWSHKVVQASAGALPRMHIQQTTDAMIPTLVAALPLAALVARDGQPPDAFPAHPRWLVVGSEAHGLPDDVISQCVERVTLPMVPEVESLNAAMATAIAAYTMRW